MKTEPVWFCQNPGCRNHVAVDVSVLVLSTDRGPVRAEHYLRPNRTKVQVCSECRGAYEFIRRIPRGDV